MKMMKSIMMICALIVSQAQSAKLWKSDLEQISSYFISACSYDDFSYLGTAQDRCQLRQDFGGDIILLQCNKYHIDSKQAVELQAVELCEILGFTPRPEPVGSVDQRHDDFVWRGKAEGKEVVEFRPVAQHWSGVEEGIVSVRRHFDCSDPRKIIEFYALMLLKFWKHSSSV